MTVELSVDDVRDALAREGGAAAGGPARRSLERAFQRTFGALASGDPARGGGRLAYEFGDDVAEGRRRLVEHAYATSVGPWLAREQRHLHAAAPQVLVFWGAVRALGDWLYDAFSALRAGDDGHARWQDAARALQATARFEGELCEPGWSEPVRLTGAVEAILEPRQGRRLCVVELALGALPPEAELGRAALYRLLARRASPAAAPAPVALVRFSPDVEEISVDERAIADAEANVLRLIGRLAGVDRSAPRATPAPASAATALPWPTSVTITQAATMSAAAEAERAPVPSLRISNETSKPPSPAPATAGRYGALGEQLQRALREHVPDVQVVGAPAVGPRFVRFQLRLGRGGKVDKVKAVAREVGLRLELKRDPIVMHAMGRLTIDLERSDPEALPFAAIRGELEALRKPEGSSCLPVGVDLGGTLHVADLADPSSAHALVAGTTGSGKTEWLRTAIAGLILANTPETLRLLLIDPKRVAFSDLRRSPYLWSPSAFWDNSGGADVVELLEALEAEMDRRYGLLAAAGADNLLEYVARGGGSLPRLVCFCDEYFALLAQGDSAQEKAVKRLIGVLGAKGRAAGVHLVLATQQPSRRVVSGPIDANIPCRVGLMMASAIDSRMIIQTQGAEKLTGRGDLLYKSIGDPVRLQSPYLTSAERARVFNGG